MRAGIGAAFLLLLLLVFVSAPLGAQDTAPEASPDVGLDPMAARYELGNGLKLGESGFTLGGYGELVYQDAKGSDPQAAVDALSAILWWDGGGRWHFFAELELEDGLIARKGDTTTDEAELVSERLYFDYIQADVFKLRLGKFLTPVGRWNLIHAAPLTWTTSRPLITETTFPTNATGAMVYGVLPFTAEGIEYSIYGAIGEELFPEDDLDTFREALGGRLAASPLPNTQIGLSVVSFEQESTGDEHKTLYGLDLLWSWRQFELSGELAYRTITSGPQQRDEEGHYLQLVTPTPLPRLFLVLREEAFHVSAPDRDQSLSLVGLNYRWRPALTFKAEYSWARDDELQVPEGFLASIAVLF